MPERSRSPEGPRHLVAGAELSPWWRAVDRRRLAFGLAFTLLAAPVLVLDNVSAGPAAVDAVETVASSTSSTSSTSSSTTSTTLAPPRAAPPTTAAPTTTAPPTTSPPTTAPRPVTTAPPTTAAPTTVPPTTAPPAPPPPPAGSVEEIIHAHFGAAGEDAVAVARCESGLNPSAYNPAGYYGLFQFSRSHAAAFQSVTGRSFDDAWSDADANTRYARYVYDRSGWSAWGCRHVVS